MQIKALILDIDGTLFDSNWQHVDAWAEAFAGEGYDFDRQTIHDQVGKGGDNLVPTLVPDAPDDVKERLEKAEGPIYKDKYRDSVRPFPGARELMVEAKKRGQQVVLASSANGPDLDFYVDLLDAKDLLSSTTSKDDVEHSKPCPDIFAAALEKLGVSAEEAVVVGDTPYDISAAAKIGVKTVALRSGAFTDEQLSGAIEIYDDVAELLANYDRSYLSRSSVDPGRS
jgi:HAD superfamily hydrolase (TIGR01509 family)